MITFDYMDRYLQLLKFYGEIQDIIIQNFCVEDIEQYYAEIKTQLWYEFMINNLEIIEN